MGSLNLIPKSVGRTNYVQSLHITTKITCNIILKDPISHSGDHIYDMSICNDVVYIPSFIMRSYLVLVDRDGENLKINYEFLLFLTFLNRTFL
jgi:hypothetical protein